MTRFTSSSSAFSKQAGGEGGREHLGFFVGDLAAVEQAALVQPAWLQAGQQQAEAIGDVEIAAQRGQRLGIERGDVHRVADRAGGEVVDQQLDRFDGDLRLGFLGARAEVRRAEDAGHAEQRAVGAGLGREHVERDAAELAALQPFDQRRFVVDAAAGALISRAPGFSLAISAVPIRSRVSSVSGVWTVR